MAITVSEIAASIRVNDGDVFGICVCVSLLVTFVFSLDVGVLPLGCVVVVVVGGAELVGGGDEPLMLIENIPSDVSSTVNPLPSLAIILIK